MKLLVVEDEVRLAAYLKQGLEADGYAVDVAADGEEGLWLARNQAYQAIVLDIMLPKRNGYQVCADLRAEGNWTPVLMLTAKDGDFDVVLGNPPYFNVDATYGARHPLSTYLRGSYPHVYTDKTDVYYYFLAKAVSLAKQRVGFIVSRAFFEADKATRTRAHLPQAASLTHAVDFNAFQVFPDAGISTAILVFDTTGPHEASTVAVRKLQTARHGRSVRR